MSSNKAIFEIPGVGQRLFVCTDYGYGKLSKTTEGQSRRTRAFYQQKVSSMNWYVRLVFPEYGYYDRTRRMLRDYCDRAADPVLKPILPITVTIPSRNWTRRGYPVSDIEFGDEVPKVLWSLTVSFASGGSDPDVVGASASAYAPPLRDIALGAAFRPGAVEGQPSAPRSSPYATQIIVRS